MSARPARPGSRRIPIALGAIALAGLAAAPGATPADARTIGICTRPPEAVRMRPTQQAPGSRGTMMLTQPASPFGVTVDAAGHQVYEVTVEIERLRRRAGGHYVVWAATPELDRTVRLGVLGDADRVSGPVAWNKFLVFVSEEAAPDVDTWAGPILLTGLSPSGRMHTMAGHGPFEDANCSDFIY